MKTATYLILLLFVSFLAAPTVVSVINKSCDTSYFFTVAEEELTHKALKEYKLQLENTNAFNIKTLSAAITSKSQAKHDNVTSSIFSPPPNV